MSNGPTPPPSKLNGHGFGSGTHTGAARQNAPAGPPPSTLHGFTFGSSEPAGEQPPERNRRTAVLRLALAGALLVGAVAGGAAMIHQGATPAVAHEAPLPAQPDYQAPPEQEPVGAPGVTTVPVENSDTGGGDAGWSDPGSTTPVTEMSVELMEPMSVFIPEAKLYSLAQPSDVFEPSKYQSMTSIQVPDNPRRSVWHSAGGAMAGTNADGTRADAGTTFLGSHSGYEGLWGAYLHTAGLTGGEAIWTKDAQGNVQRWQVDRIRYMPHTEFPQKYWNADGERRLVLTTCGGTAGADGVFNQNVFVEAKPVQLVGSGL